MNKLISKIVGVALGLSLAVGTGVAIAANSNSVSKADAAEDTVTKTTNDLVTELSWNVSSGSNMNGLYTSWSLDDVITISTSGSPNCGSVWGTSTYDWRLYQAQSGDVTATAASGYIIKSVTYTYSSNNSGVLKNGNSNVTSGTSVTVNASSKTLTVGNSSNKTNGQVRITAFSVTYEQQQSQAINIGNPEKIDSANGLNISATLTGLSGTPTWSANPNTGVSFTSANPTKMTVSSDVANGTVIDVTASLNSVTSNTKKVVVSNNAGTTQNTAFEADEATALIKNGLYNSGETYFAAGYVKSSTYYSSSSTASLYLTTDSNNTSIADSDCLYLFKAVGATGVDITTLQQGFFVVVTGTMNYYQSSSAQFNSGCTILSVTTPAVVVDSVTVVADSAVDAGGSTSVDALVEYEVTYDGTSGTGTVSVQIENSQGEETGYEYTTPAGGSFTVTFTANDTYTITVTSTEDDTVSDSTSITVSGIVTAVLKEYETFSSELISGDEYIIVNTNENYVLGNTVANGRIANGTLPTISNNKISTDDYSIVWIISKVGDYYTLQNKDTSKYLGGTGVANKATVLDSVTDYAKWSVSYSDGAWEFVNYGNSSQASAVNANLRQNTTNGWACYGTGTGTKIHLFHEINTSRALTDLSITTNSSKTSFSQGEKFSVPDLVVTATFDAAPLTIEYSGMTESDSKGLTFSPAIGSTLTSTGSVEITISLTYNNHTESTSFTVSVVAYNATTYSKVSSLDVDLRGTYLVVYEDGTNAYILNSALASSNSSMDVVSNYVSGTINDNTITGSVTIDAAAVQVVRSVVDGVSHYYLRSSQNTYYSSTASKLNVVSTPTSGYEFSIAELNDGLRPYIGSNVIKFNSTANQMRFRVYGESSTVAEVSLYKLDATSAINSEVNGFVSSFYSSFKSTADGGLCDSNGNSNVSSLNSAWSTLASSFANLSPDAQGILASTSYTHDSETAGTKADIIDRYDYIYSKYSASLTAGDFMARSGLTTYQATGSQLAHGMQFAPMNNNALIIVVITAFVTMTFVGGYFFLRKKKEN